MITKNFILKNKDKWEEYKEEINNLNKHTITEIIIEEPDIIDIINLDKLSGEDISYILICQPRLIKDLKSYLHKLTRGNVFESLEYQPDLIRDLKSYLHKLNGENISWVLTDYPYLIRDLKPYLYKLDEIDISRVLRFSPELSLFFKYLNTEYQDAAYYYTYPSEISKLDDEEKYELSKKMVELIKEEKR